MIKRYTLKEDEIHVNPRRVIKLPYLSEHKHGEYIRYADHEAMLESIGAGGVSGQRISSEPSAELIAEIKSMAAIQLVNGKAELINVREIIHAVLRATAR